jgi:hypothetical protein
MSPEFPPPHPTKNMVHDNNTAKRNSLFIIESPKLVFCESNLPGTEAIASKAVNIFSKEDHVQDEQDNNRPASTA